MENISDFKVKSALLKDLGLHNAFKYAKNISYNQGIYSAQYERIANELEIQINNNRIRNENLP